MPIETASDISFKVKGVEAVFASDLGWKPGVFPTIATFASKTWERSHAIVADGDLIGWIYHQHSEKPLRELMVYND